MWISVSTGAKVFIATKQPPNSSATSALGSKEHAQHVSITDLVDPLQNPWDVCTNSELLQVVGLLPKHGYSNTCRNASSSEKIHKRLRPLGVPHDMSLLTVKLNSYKAVKTKRDLVIYSPQL